MTALGKILFMLYTLATILFGYVLGCVSVQTRQVSCTQTETSGSTVTLHCQDTGAQTGAPQEGAFQLEIPINVKGKPDDPRRN